MDASRLPIAILTKRIFKSNFEINFQIQNAQVVQLDRWLIDIEGHKKRRLHMNWLPHRKLNMYNYFSIGVDAQIALNFHKARDSPFYVISSRIFNKVSICEYSEL